MNFDKAKEELELSFGNPLTPELLEHIGSCDSCRAFQNELNDLTGSLGDDTLFYLTDEQIEESVLTIENSIESKDDNQTDINGIIPPGWLKPLASVAAVFLLLSVTYSGYLISQRDSSPDTASISTLNNSIVETTYVAMTESITTEKLDEEMISVLIEDLSSDGFFGAGELLLDDLTDEEMKYLKENLSVGDML